MTATTDRSAAPATTGTAQRPDTSSDQDSRPAATGLGVEADVMVIFGITGDLARKMTFRALYRLERRRLLHCPIIGVAHDELPLDELRDRARAAINAAEGGIDDTVFDRLGARLSYLHGDVDDDHLYRQLATQVGQYHRPLFYLEMPPSLFATIVEHLGAAGLLEIGRVAVEKPFGRDLASARELNASLHRVLREDQILRVDHFLGKEPVIELEYLRFANLAIAEIWDRKSVSCIQITMAENFGVTDRGAFYDSVGALRDVVQNHLLQVLALVAMEPPAGASADELRDKKVDVFTARPAADPQQCVRGQYAGYTDVTGVAPGSRSCPPTPRSRPTRSCCGSTLPGPTTTDTGPQRRLVATGSPRHPVRPRARRAATTPRTAPPRRPGRRPGPVRPTGRRRTDLAHRATTARHAGETPPLPPPGSWAPPRPMRWCAGTPAGNTPGSTHPRNPH